MEWLKRGRKSQGTERGWTRKELSVLGEPVMALAEAVVKQWKEDGCPERDRPGVMPWVYILEGRWKA